MARLSVSAARTSADNIAVALVNVDPNRALPVSLSLAGRAVREARAEALTAPAMDARNTFDDPDAVRPARLATAVLRSGVLSLTMPPKSIVVLTLH